MRGLLNVKLRLGGGVSRTARQRFVALFFVLLLLFGSFELTFSSLLVRRAEAASKTPGGLRSEMAQSYSPEAGASGSPIKDQEVPLVNDPSKFTPPTNLKEEEIVSERGPNRIVTRKSDGSYEAKVFSDAVNYQKDGQWQRIDKTLIEDKNAADSGNIVGQVWGNVRSVFAEQSTYKVKANDWQARFAPTGDKVGMLRYQKDGFDISFKPVNARSGVAPVIVNEDGVQKVKYSDVWNGVDLVYEVTGSKIKEFIIVKSPGAETQIAFSIEGAKLEEDKDNPGGFKIVGLEGISIAPISVSLNNFGPWTDSAVATQSYKDGELSVAIDKDWLKNLGSDKFPVVIDPTVQDSGVGLTYTPYKSDGYVGNSNSFWMNAGTSLDNYKKWRTAFRADYSFLQGKTLIDAQLYLSRATYTTESLYYEVSHANCLCYNGIDYGAPRTSLWFGQDGWINVYPQYKWLTDIGDWGGWLMLNGEERNYYTLKGFRDNAYVRFAYTSKPPVTTPIRPADKQVVVTNQPTLSVNTIAPANGDQVKYYFRVTTNSDAETGTVFNSGWIDSPTWTLPESALQDNTTYYWHVYSSQWNGPNQYNQTNPNWVRSFKVDLRNGKDSTQSYDTAGPISVNLATGNAITSASTHSMSALGGSIGMGVDYDSPYAAKQGLVAEYFNNKTFSGSPVVTRLEANIDNQWDIGSPSHGVVPTDNFSARYTGYFVVPKTGTYQFGGNNDDGMTIKATINNVQQVVYSSTICSGVCYGGATSVLNEGDVIPITVEYTEATGLAYVKMFVKGAISERIVPTEMLRTAPKLVANDQGLNANYYYDSGNHVFPSSTTAAFASRRESKISFNWGGASPIPTGPWDNFMASYDGYITVPTSGTYQFGADNNDAARIWINGQLVMDQWANDAVVGKQWGSNVFLTGRKAVSIRVEFYETGGGASLYLNVRGAVAEQEVPASWLSVKVPLLPSGWDISLDADGSLKYDYAVIRPSSVLLVNADGSTDEYTWNGKGYKPPANEYGTLVKNQDGTLTLQDADGMTYVFAADGTLRSTSSTADDRKPTSLQYEYSSTPSRLTRIIDPVDPTRFGTVRYNGDSLCPSAPSGFDSEAPANMICAFDTTDGNSTKFFYKSGQLARLELPGGDITDIGYDTLGRIVQQKSSVANDVIQAGLRANDAGVTTEISYDVLGRVSKVTEPAPNAGDARREHTYTYRLDARVTEMRISNTSEPNGYTSKVEYDALYRAVKVYDKTGNANLVEYDSVKDLVLSSTTATGLKSTTIYDSNDLPTDTYGPAPTAWFGADRKPLAAYVSQVPHTQTNYDEGLVGPAVSYYGYKSGSLVGAPRLHTTGTVPTDPGNLHKDWTTSPITINTANGETGFGFRATGILKVSSTNTYYFSLWRTDGVRMYIDDQQVVNDWTNGPSRGTVGSKYLEAGKSYRFLLEYYDADGLNAGTDFYMSPGSASTASTYRYWTNYLKPDYSLVTSTKTYDSTIGDATAAASYGSNPELGQVQSTTVDPTGLNLTNSATYEPYQSGSLMRQTSKSLPGGTTTNYVYYGATETRDNPCTPGTEAFKQAGFIKQKTEQDPDGAGSQTGRISETVYDDTGRAVASRFNSDPWTCITYDARSRATQTIVPTINGRPGRTVATNYNYQGSPLKVQVVDSVAGTTVSEVDLLGRSVSATDQFGDISTVTYDAEGRISSKTTPLGTESYTYDTYDRVTEYKHDNTKYATVTYDQYSRVQDVTYNQAQGSSNQSTGPGPNLVANPSLEAAAQGNPNAPDKWSTDSWDVNTPVFSYPSDGHTGSRSVKTQVTSYTSGDAKWYFDHVNVTGGTNYTVSDWYKANVEAEVVMEYIDQNDNYDYEWLGTTDPAASWTQASYTFTAPATAVKATLLHVMDKVGWIQIDDVDLHVTSQTTTTSGSALKLEQIKRDAMQRTSGAVFRFANGTAFDETVTSSQTGRVTAYTDAFGGSSAAGTYSYDKAGRLTGANIDGKTYGYGYGTPSGCTGAYNATANKNSNRTSFTANGQTTTYCYDLADRLLSSTDTQLGTPTYDDHGNTTQLAGNGTPITFTYDAIDSNTAIQQGNYKVEYVKTASGSVLRKKEYQDNTLAKNYRYLAGGAVLQTCNLDNDNDCTTTDKYLNLPGGVALTLSPTNPDTTKRTVYSIKNFHGDTAITANEAGNPTSSVFLYEPFGQPSASTTFGTNSNPANATDQSMGWAASPTRKVAGAFTLAIVQMGARVYLPTAGRFLQVDPVEGGVHNAYVYVADPINGNDYSGLCAYIIQCTASASFLQPAATTQQIQQASSASSTVRISTASKSKPVTISIAPAASPYVMVVRVAPVSIGFADDFAGGFERQASVFGTKLQQGSSVAGRNLPTVSRLAKNPVIKGVGSLGLIGTGVEFAGNYMEGDSLGRNALKTGVGAAGGIAGGAAGGAVCGFLTFGTGGLAAITCPTLIGVGGVAGSWLGNKFGEGVANFLGW